MRQLLAASVAMAFLSACSDNRPETTEYGAWKNGDNQPNVILETELGNIEIEVFGDKAPISARDFLYYVDEGLYNGEGFYRVVRPATDPLELGMEIIQGGRLDTQAVTQGLDHETTEMTGLSNTSGTVGIARDKPGSGSAAYFFINISDNTFLDYGGVRNPDGQGYAVFGQVTAGMDTVRAIQAREAASDVNDPNGPKQYLTKPVIITKAYRK